jgi:hypothetical protein
MRVEGLAGRRFDVQFVCAVGDRVLPWWVAVVDGSWASICAGFVSEPHVAVSHTVDAGRVALGLTTTAPVAFDDFGLERWDGRRWLRYRLPPGDEPDVPIGVNVGLGRCVLWLERVMRSPIGDVDICRVVEDGELMQVDARPASASAVGDVMSRVAWCDLMDDRLSPEWERPASRVQWRGSAADIHAMRVGLRTVRSALDADREARIERTTRDQVLVDAVAILRGIGRCLRDDGSPAEPVW